MLRKMLLATTALALASGASAATHKHLSQKIDHNLAPGLHEVVFGKLHGIVNAGAPRHAITGHFAPKKAKCKGGTCGKAKQAVYNPLAGWSVEWFSFASTFFTSTFYEAIAQQLAGDGGTHSTATTALGFGETTFGYGNTANVALMSDSGGLPGSVLATGTANANELVQETSFFYANDCCAVQSVALSNSVTTNSGTNYWLAAAPSAPKTYMGWNRQTIDFTLADVGSAAESIGASFFSTFCTFFGTTPFCASSSSSGWAVFNGQEEGVAAAL